MIALCFHDGHAGARVVTMHSIVAMLRIVWSARFIPHQRASAGLLWGKEEITQ
jgi:hypothetical protein